VKSHNIFTSILLVLVCFGVSQATTRRYTGVEVQNLIDTVNALSAVAVQNEANISTLCHKLDSDAGVTDTTYFSSISPTTTAANTLRR
jgi:hypothetical protein